LRHAARLDLLEDLARGIVKKVPLGLSDGNVSARGVDIPRAAPRDCAIDVQLREHGRWRTRREKSIGVGGDLLAVAVLQLFAKRWRRIFEPIVLPRRLGWWLCRRLGRWLCRRLGRRLIRLM
jgi:hypothetical protein